MEAFCFYMNYNFLKVIKTYGNLFDGNDYGLQEYILL